MTRDELILRRLQGQHLLRPAEPLTVVEDLCGLQAQFLSHALHALRIRSGGCDTDGMVKSWTNRGTMHLFAEKDLPLFLHPGRTHFLRSVDTMADDDAVSAQRKHFFGEIILNAVGSGTCTREELKQLCRNHGMTDREAASLFDPWGGIIRALCEECRLCHQVSETKAYRLCPKFAPMDGNSARLELARRYFTHYGPATIKDAAYFFGCTQAAVKAWLPLLPLTETEYSGKPYYFLESGVPAAGTLPDCLFLAGFDPLLLGYEKKESLILSSEHLRSIFTLAGIVRPALLLDGRVAGWWSLKNRKLTVTLFSPADESPIRREAEKIWPDLKSITFSLQR